MNEETDCHICGIYAVYDKGIIYYRAKNKMDKWDNLPICSGCWYEEKAK